MELEYLNRYPNFKKIVQLVVNNSHLQKTKILNFHKKVDEFILIEQSNFQKIFKNI